jgi:hypothetical protein
LESLLAQFQEQQTWQVKTILVYLLQMIAAPATFVAQEHA